MSVCVDGAEVSSRPPVRVLRVLQLGYGRVGQAIAALAERERDALESAGLRIEFTAALVRDLSKPRLGPGVPLTSSISDEWSRADVVIEALGGVEPARTLVAAALEAGVPVVTANKSLVAAHGAALRTIASRRRTPLAYEAAVIAGVPFVGAVARRPFVARARRIEGILNGTSHFVLSSMAGGASFEAALASAIERGYAEPDSSADVSGRDAAEKLTILLHLCGHGDASTTAVARAPIDVVDQADVRAARALGGTIKPIALAVMETPEHSGAWVGPALVDASHPLAAFDGVDNAVELIGPGDRRAAFSGPGAGPDITAATVLDDVVEIARGASTEPWSLVDGIALSSAFRWSAPPRSSWFLRLTRDASLDTAHALEFLSARGMPAVQAVTEDDRLYVRTVPVEWAAASSIASLFGAISAAPLILPVLDRRTP